MKILILSAMDEEISYTKQKYQAKVIDELNGQEVSYHKAQVHEFYFANSGVGKVNAAITTTLLINKYNPDLVVSIGTAGGVCSELKIGDIVVGDKLAFHDVDVTGFGYDLGQLPGEGVYHIPSDYEFMCQKLNESGLKYHTGTITTGDMFVNDLKLTNLISSRFDNIYAIEMESTAIVMTCNHMKVRSCVIRTISDLAHEESSVEFSKYLEIVSEKFYQLVEVLDNE